MAVNGVIRFDDGSVKELPEPTLEFQLRPKLVKAVQISDGVDFRIRTENGTEWGEPSDWLVQGEDGKLFVMKDKAFQELYKET